MEGMTYEKAIMYLEMLKAMTGMAAGKVEGVQAAGAVQEMRMAVDMGIAALREKKEANNITALPRR